MRQDQTVRTRYLYVICALTSNPSKGKFTRTCPFGRRDRRPPASDHKDCQSVSQLITTAHKLYSTVLHSATYGMYSIVTYSLYPGTVLLYHASLLTASLLAALGQLAGSGGSPCFLSYFLQHNRVHRLSMIAGATVPETVQYSVAPNKQIGARSSVSSESANYSFRSPTSQVSFDIAIPYDGDYCIVLHR